MAALTISVPMTAATAQPSAGAGSAVHPPVQAAQNYRGLRASQVIDMGVRNPQGQDIGKVADMMVDMRSGQVLYAIIAFDPGLLQGDRLFAVPTSKLRLASDRDSLLFDMPRETLERAGLNRSEWQQRVRDPAYLATLDRVWGLRESTAQARLWRISDLLGKNVKDRSGQPIGEIDELVVDMGRQRVHYAVLEFDPGWASPERRFAFGMSAFDRRAGQDELVLDVDRASVQAMRSFTADQYANLNEPTWVTDVDRLVMAQVPARGTASRSAAAPPQARGGGTASGTAAPDTYAARDPRADRN